MLRFINLVKFQLKLYVKNSYFVMLVITTTTMELYQYLAHYVNQTYTGQEWLIAEYGNLGLLVQLVPVL